jgi:hypothetical protein
MNNNSRCSRRSCARFSELQRASYAYWVESMARDMDKAANDDFEEKLVRELEKFQESVFGIAASSSELTESDSSAPLTWV